MMRLSVWWSLLPLAAVAADECSLYMAESSTSTAEAPKWGIYAGVDFEEGVELGPPDIAIQVHNLMANAFDQDDEEEEEEDEKSLERQSAEMIERFTWVPDSSAGAFEMSAGKINTVIAGTALLAAYNAKTTNANFNISSAYFRPSLGESPGEAHPGRGASSHFFNVGLKSTTKIPAGHEIFMDYGENFSDDDDDSEGALSADDYEKIDKLVESMIEFLEKHKDELDETAKMEIYNFLIKDVMNAAAGVNKGKLVADILPHNPDELRLVKEAGGSRFFGSNKDKRDTEWLKTEGMCMDNLVAGASTIPHAGRGAFARRDLATGTSIAPIPLIHIPDKSVLDMHEVDADEGFRKSEDVLHQQLLLNYCFGHPESSILLLPTGPLVPLVNHNEKKANAKLVWSKHSLHQSHWLEMDPEELLSVENQYIGLAMELVATKNIKEGEEVFLDYGREWQEAWDAHVKEWNAKVASGEIHKEWPIRALDLNDEYRNKAFKTPVELEKDPYPENVRLGCFLVVDEENDEDGSEANPKTWDGEEIFITQNFFSCTIKDRVEAEPFNYTVMAGKTKPRFIKNVPHRAIAFIDKAGTSDQFFAGTFRHAIGIPDDIFPKGPWRDLAEE